MYDVIMFWFCRVCSIWNTVFVFDGLAEGGQSTFGSQRRDIRPAKETRRVQGAPAVCRRPVRRSIDRSSLSDTTRFVGRIVADLQPVSHRLHAVWRAQAKCKLQIFVYCYIIIIIIILPPLYTVIKSIIHKSGWLVFLFSHNVYEKRKNTEARIVHTMICCAWLMKSAGIVYNYFNIIWSLPDVST